MADRSVAPFVVARRPPSRGPDARPGAHKAPIVINPPRPYSRLARTPAATVHVPARNVRGPSPTHSQLQGPAQPLARLAVADLVGQSPDDLHRFLYAQQKTVGQPQFRYAGPTLPISAKMKRLLPVDNVDRLQYSCEFFGRRMARRLEKLVPSDGASHVNLSQANFMVYRYVYELCSALNSHVAAAADADREAPNMPRPLLLDAQEAVLNSEHAFFAAFPAASTDWAVADCEQTLSVQARNQTRELLLALVLLEKVAGRYMALIQCRHAALKRVHHELATLEEQNCILKDVLQQHIRMRPAAEIIVRRLVEHPVIHLYKHQDRVGVDEPVAVAEAGTSTDRDLVEHLERSLSDSVRQYHAQLWRHADDGPVVLQAANPADLVQRAAAEAPDVAQAWTSIQMPVLLAQPKQANAEAQACVDTADMASGDTSGIIRVDKDCTAAFLTVDAANALQANARQLEHQLAQVRAQSECERVAAAAKLAEVSKEKDVEIGNLQRQLEVARAEVTRHKEALEKERAAARLERNELECTLSQQTSRAEQLQTSHEALQRTDEQRILEVESERNQFRAAAETLRKALQVQSENHAAECAALRQQSTAAASETASSANERETLRLELADLREKHQVLGETHQRLLQASERQSSHASDKQQLSLNSSRQDLQHANIADPTPECNSEREIAQLRKVIELLMRYPDASTGERMQRELEEAMAKNTAQSAKIQVLDQEACEIIHVNNLRISLLEWKNHELRAWRIQRAAAGSARGAGPHAPSEWNAQLPQAGRRQPAPTQLWNGRTMAPSKQNLSSPESLASAQAHGTRQRPDSARVRPLVMPQHVLTASLVRKSLSDASLAAPAPESVASKPAVSVLRYKHAISQVFQHASGADATLLRTRAPEHAPVDRRLDTHALFSSRTTTRR